MPPRRTWNSDPAASPPPDPHDAHEPRAIQSEQTPVELVDDADAREFDELDGEFDEFGNDIHEHLDDEDLEGDLDDTELGPGDVSAHWHDENGDDDDDGDLDDDGDDALFVDTTHLPSERSGFSMHGRFEELRRGLHHDGDDNDDDDDDDEFSYAPFGAHMDDDGDVDAEDDDEEADEDSIGRGIQGLLDMQRRLRRMPDAGGAGGPGAGDEDSEDLRRASLLNALRGVFPGEASGFGRLGFMDSRLDLRLGRVMASLKSADSGEVQTALTELSSILLMSNGGFMGIPLFPVNSVARSLVQLLQQSDDIEVLVMTARAMAQLVDNGIEGSVRALIDGGIIPVLRLRFENIGYIDLVEQLIRVVKPVATVEPRLVLESGCLLPCLNTLDFFGTYIQKQILSAADACAHAVSTATVGPARELLAALPSPPSELVVGTLCQLVSAIAKRSPPDADLREVVPLSMWETLVGHISAQTPHVARVLRACGHIAARCPEYVQSRAALASLVAATLTQGAADAFAALLATPKETLFNGLKLLQVLLPPAPAIGPFAGPYRKAGAAPDAIALDDLREYALSAVPTAVAVYGASTSTPVRQLALLVIIQTAAANSLGFALLARDLQLPAFAAQVVAENSDGLALTVGGLDLAWDLAKDPELLAELWSTGIAADLGGLSGDAEPTGTYAPTDDLTPVAQYMARHILEQLRTQQAGGDYTGLLADVRAGTIDAAELAAAPLPELLRAGLLDALRAAGEPALRRNLTGQLVAVLQTAVSRLERFSLQLTPGHTSSSLVGVLARSVNVRVTERNYPNNGWTLSVPAVSSLRSIEEFILMRLSRVRIVEVSAPEAHLAFYIGDERVPTDVSVLKALYSQLNHSRGDHHSIPHLQFERVSHPEPPAESVEPSLARHGELGEALELLATLARENEARNEPVPWSAFQNAKLTAKLTRQMADALAVAASMLPQWTFDTVMLAPFLYPLRTRLQFVQLTSFGLGRNLRLLRQMEDRQGDDGDEDEGGGEPDDDDRILGRHRRQKYRLARDKLLEGSLRLLEMSCKNPAVLDVMFLGEEGTGRGPTQEFFALASRELSNVGLGVWRETPAGLFPSPQAQPQDGTRIFEGVGRLIARALLDKRILDFRLNPAFFSVVLGSPPTLETLRRVDAQLAASLSRILTSSPQDIDDMGLDFVLPGTTLELVPNGADIEVSADNAADYVARVIDRVIGNGIRPQIDAFSKGFSTTIPISALHAFMTDELVGLCGAGRTEDWSEEALLEALRADHGYSMQSVPVKSLVKVLASFDESERRKFLMFATGSPHLPIGGFKALNPPFTVVVKHPESESIEKDKYLPSVMTCVNYLKLPQYSSEEVMREQLVLAMSEGSEAFPLS